jgi:hypothetical protein
MLYREIIAVCGGIHTKHITALCGENVELWMLNLVVHKVTTRFYSVMWYCKINFSYAGADVERV